ncbi:MAG TPA: hypothetical protein VHJ79_00345 [Mycobacterium sp.]|jgi:hypothetical protein|nr:hypothetical protein [Mycobacterium sp.]
MQRTLIAGLATAALVSSGFGLAAGTAQADNAGPYQWCPGQDMVFSPQTGSTGPGRDKIWDMNVCHTWYFVDYGKGNVPSKYPPPPESNVWDGDNPPPSDRCYPWCL